MRVELEAESELVLGAVDDATSELERTIVLPEAEHNWVEADDVTKGARPRSTFRDSQSRLRAKFRLTCMPNCKPACWSSALQLSCKQAITSSRKLCVEHRHCVSDVAQEVEMADEPMHSMTL